MIGFSNVFACSRMPVQRLCDLLYEDEGEKEKKWQAGRKKVLLTDPFFYLQNTFSLFTATGAESPLHFPFGPFQPVRW